MNLAFITPTKYINEFGNQGDFILALSHLMDYEETNDYEKAVKNTKLPVILDNGLFENHKAEGIETLIEKAKMINAHTFFAPDVLYNSKETQKELSRAQKLNEGTGLGLAAVVQADNYYDYINQLLDFNSDPNVDLIGLSILSIPKSFEKSIGEYNITKSRIALLDQMIIMNRREGTKWKNCHLLGIGDSYEDVVFAHKYCPFVVSNDSSSAFQTGLNNKIYYENLQVPGGKIKEKVDFDLQEITIFQEQCIQTNINLIKESCK